MFVNKVEKKKYLIMRRSFPPVLREAKERVADNEDYKNQFMSNRLCDLFLLLFFSLPEEKKAPKKKF